MGHYYCMGHTMSTKSSRFPRPPASESVEFKLRKLESGQALSGSKQDVNKKGTYGAVVAGEGWAPSEPSTETPFRVRGPSPLRDPSRAIDDDTVGDH